MRALGAPPERFAAVFEEVPRLPYHTALRTVHTCGCCSSHIFQKQKLHTRSSPATPRNPSNLRFCNDMVQLRRRTTQRRTILRRYCTVHQRQQQARHNMSVPSDRQNYQAHARHNKMNTRLEPSRPQRLPPSPPSAYISLLSKNNR